MYVIITIASLLIILGSIGISAHENEVKTMRAAHLKRVLKQAEVDRQIEEIIRKCEQDRIERERARSYREQNRGCGWYSS